jgi:hypothetical protein
MSENEASAALQIVQEAIEKIKNMGMELDDVLPVTAEKSALYMLASEFVESGAPNGCVYRLQGDYSGVPFDVIVNVYHANVEDPATQVLRQLEEFGKFHPRALKLLTKMKEFLVVAHDEPYYWDVYGMIRKSEMGRNTWTEEDESRYREKWVEEAANCLIDRGNDIDAGYYAEKLYASEMSHASPQSPSAAVESDTSYWGE